MTASNETKTVAVQHPRTNLGQMFLGVLKLLSLVIQTAGCGCLQFQPTCLRGGEQAALVCIEGHGSQLLAAATIEGEAPLTLAVLSIPHKDAARLVPAHNLGEATQTLQGDFPSWPTFVIVSLTGSCQGTPTWDCCATSSMHICHLQQYHSVTKGSRSQSAPHACRLTTSNAEL